MATRTPDTRVTETPPFPTTLATYLDSVCGTSGTKYTTFSPETSQPFTNMALITPAGADITLLHINVTQLSNGSWKISTLDMICVYNPIKQTVRFLDPFVSDPLLCDQEYFPPEESNPTDTFVLIHPSCQPGLARSVAGYSVPPEGNHCTSRTPGVIFTP